MLAGDDVGVGDDDAGAKHPARALDVEAAGGALDANDAAAVAPGGGAAEHARIGRRQGPVGDRGEHRERVEPRQRVQHLVGGDMPQQRRQHGRALDVAAQAECGLGERDDRDQPGHGEPERGAGDQPAGRVREPQRAVQKPAPQHHGQPSR